MPANSRRAVLPPPIVAVALLVLLVLVAAQSAATDPRPAALDPGPAWHTSPWGQLVFFAVLEGLYTDGVQPEVVRAVLHGPLDAETGLPVADPSQLAPDEWWQRHLETTLFVPACPLCSPALVAFETYAARGSLHFKGYHEDGRPLDTFGPGLPARMVARLTDPDRQVRLVALQELVTAWIERRLDFGRATPNEREELQHWMEEGRKRGMGQLASLRRSLDPGAAVSWPRCATCDASVEACTR